MSKLTDAIRAKYPDAYKDVDDDTLEKSVLAKYPQYKQYATPTDKNLESDTGSDNSDLNAARQTLSKVNQADAERYKDVPVVSTELPEPEDFGDQVEKGINKLTRPFESVRRFNQRLASAMTNPNNQPLMNGQGGIHDLLAKGIAMSKGFAAGVLGGDETGAGGVIDTLIGSPINAAFSATGALGKVLPEAYVGTRAALPYIEKALSAPLAYEGLNNTLGSDKSVGERGQGLLEMAGAALPFLHSPQIGESHVTNGDIFAKPTSVDSNLNPPGISSPENVAPPLAAPTNETSLHMRNKPRVKLVEPPSDITFVDPDTGEIMNDTTPTPQEPSVFQIYQDYRKTTRTNGGKPLDFQQWVAKPENIEYSNRVDGIQSNARQLPNEITDESGRPIAPLEGNEPLVGPTNDPRDQPNFADQVLPPEPSGDIFENKTIGTGNNFAEQKAKLDQFREQARIDRGDDISRSNSDELTKSETNEPFSKPTPVSALDRFARTKDAMGNIIHFHDTGGRFTPEEFKTVATHPITQELGKQISNSFDELMTTMPHMLKNLEKNGIVFDESIRGIHIRDKATNRQAILINPLQLMKMNTPDGAAAGFVHTILHEAAHLLVGAHNENFTTTLANIYEKYGAERAINAQKQFLQTVSDGAGGYSPEVQNLLSKYSEARGRQNTRSDALTGNRSSSEITTGGKEEISRSNSSDATGTSSERKYAIRKENVTPETIRNVKAKGYVFHSVGDNGDFLFTKGKPKGNQPILESDVGIKRATRQQLGPYTDQSKGSAIKDILNIPRAILASNDMSAPLRQGIGLIHKKQYWTALPEMVKAFASEDAFNAVQESIAEKPLFKRRIVDGKEIPSFAEDAGLKLTDVHDLSNKEEAFISKYTQKIPLVKRSERAYVAFLNKLRADTFESLVNQGKIFGADGKTNVPLARGLADFVNTATGRGSLGKLESSATTLGTVFFSPRLMAARLKMMNPAYYIMAEPMVRKEALKSLLAIASAGGTTLQLLHHFGAEVSDDPNSSDFGKAKIGNTRFDPWAGYQQYIVLLNRLARDKNTKMDIPDSNSGYPMLDMANGFLNHGGSQITSSNSGHTYDINNPKFGRSNKFDVGVRFGRGKLNPLLGFVASLMAGHREITGQKMNFDMPHDLPSLMNNSIAQRFIPLVYQDLYDVYHTDPSIAKYTLPYSFFGGGVQNYQGQKFQR